jgi:hypothetical protein
VLARYPELPHTPLYNWDIKKKAIPLPIARQLGLQPDGDPFVRDWLFSDRFPKSYADHRATKQMQQQCFFTKPVADYYFSRPGDQSKTFARYFNSDCETLWVHNALYYLYFFIAGFFQGSFERPQTQIPRTLSRLLGIREAGVPGILTVIDILYLGSEGVLHEMALAKTHPKILMLIQYLKQQHFQKEKAAFARVGFLTSKHAEALHQDRQRGVKLSVFRTGFLFNMQHLLTGKKLGGIRGIYKYVNIVRYNTLICRHFSQWDKQAAARIKRLLALRPEIGKELELRSFVNIMLYLDKLKQIQQLEEGYATEFNYIKALPSVAKYQFGVPAPDLNKRKKTPALVKKKSSRINRQYYSKENRLVEEVLF